MRLFLPSFIPPYKKLRREFAVIRAISGKLFLILKLRVSLVKLVFSFRYIILKLFYYLLGLLKLNV